MSLSDWKELTVLLLVLTVSTIVLTLSTSVDPWIAWMSTGVVVFWLKYKRRSVLSE